MEKKTFYQTKSSCSSSFVSFWFFLDNSFLQIWLNFCSNDLGKTLGPYGHHHDWLVGCLALHPYSRERGRKVRVEIPPRLPNFVSNSLCQFWIHFVSLKLSQCFVILHYILVCNKILLGKLCVQPIILLMMFKFRSIDHSLFSMAARFLFWGRKGWRFHEIGFWNGMNKLLKARDLSIGLRQMLITG